MATDLERFVSAQGRDELDQGGASADRRVGRHVHLLPVHLGHRAGSWARACPRRTGRRWRARASSSSTARPRTCSSTGTASTSATAPRRPSSSACPSPRRSRCCRGTRKVARVWCICFRGREDVEDGGSFLTADCRGNLKRIQAEFRERTGLHLRAGTRARDDVAQGRRGRQADVRGHVEALLLPHRPVQPVPADHPQGDRVRERDGPRHDPGRPRGRAGPARAELQLRRRRDDRRQPLDLPPGLQAGRPRDAGLPVLHAEAVHGRLGQRLPPQHLAVATATRTSSCPRRARTSACPARSASGRSAASSSTSAR